MIDIVIIIIFLLILLRGYKKGFIKIVTKLISAIVALILAWLLAEFVGECIANTSIGSDIKLNIQNMVTDKIAKREQTTMLTMIQNQFGLKDPNSVSDKLCEYVFITLGFISVFILAKIVLWIAQKMLENIFDLPVLRTFNKLGGVIASGALFILEISIILALANTLSDFEFMKSIIEHIESTVVVKALYDYNIFTNIILSKIV